MKQTFGGAELDLGHTAWFFDFGGVPVFHHWAPGGRTRCGLTLRFDNAIGAAIPTRHAVRFGRPCRRCWGELLHRPSLFARPARGPGDGSTQLEVT